ncbi:hypothetical protein, partial [Nocardia acididurans]|uniref:hypothetical protein n=1 Tax=Nocardia acididurans TaxID=2802282 RepID=UPI001E48AB9F
AKSRAVTSDFAVVRLRGFGRAACPHTAVDGGDRFFAIAVRAEQAGGMNPGPGSSMFGVARPIQRVGIGIAHPAR